MSPLSVIFFLIVGLAVFAAAREWFLAKSNREPVPPGFIGGVHPQSYGWIPNDGFLSGQSQHHGVGDQCASLDGGCDTGGHSSCDGGHGGFAGGGDGGGPH